MYNMHIGAHEEVPFRICNIQYRINGKGSLAASRNNIIYDVIYNIIPAISRARMQKRVRPAYAYADDISFSVWYTYILYYVVWASGGLNPAAAAVVVAEDTYFK